MSYTSLILADTAPWRWWEALLSRQAVACAVIALLCAVMLPLLMRAAWRMGRQRKVDRPTLIRNADGTATLEFVLILPIILFLVLTLAQTTLLMGANVFTHYAAFAATRSAIVYIPSDQGYPEIPNTIVLDDESPKYSAIRRAAIFALVPVAGRLRVRDTVDADSFTTAMSQYYSLYGRQPPAWIDNQLGDRLRYADANTRIAMVETILRDDRIVPREMAEGSLIVVRPRDPITIRVEHQQNLAVPYIGMIFADGRLDEARGGNRYSTVAAQYTLTNEGIVDWIIPPTYPRRP